jgi:hypothetical protein
MINNINKERRRSMNATPTRPSNKNQRQGAELDAQHNQHRAQGSARTILLLKKTYKELIATDKGIKIKENK